MQRGLFFPVLGLCLWAALWIGLIWLHPEEPGGPHPSGPATHPAAGSALRAPAVEGASGQGVEQQLLPPTGSDAEPDKEKDQDE